jgi:hypothetical protein
MKREEIVITVLDAVNAEFTHKYDNVEIVNADWTEIADAIASRVADALIAQVDEMQLRDLVHRLHETSERAPDVRAVPMRLVRQELLRLAGGAQ